MKRSNNSVTVQVCDPFQSFRLWFDFMFKKCCLFKGKFFAFIRLGKFLLFCQLRFGLFNHRKQIGKYFAYGFWPQRHCLENTFSMQRTNKAHCQHSKRRLWWYSKRNTRGIEEKNTWQHHRGECGKAKKKTSTRKFNPRRRKIPMCTKSKFSESRTDWLAVV